MPKLAAFAVLAGLVSCQTAYYGVMERFGVHKRDMLVDRVQAARDAQEDTKEQFENALEQFRSVVAFEGGELEEKYDRMNSELQRSESKAQEVHQRIDSVEDVAADLFDEWERELDQFADVQLRRASEQQLRETRSRYTQLIGAMHRAEDKLEPVLVPFRDQVLFLKHNLNAQAIASLEDELITVEHNVEQLIREMDASIREADAFIQQMQE